MRGPYTEFESAPGRVQWTPARAMSVGNQQKSIVASPPAGKKNRQKP